VPNAADYNPLHGPLSVETRAGGVLAVRFAAMASPCELLLHTGDRAAATKLGEAAAAEVWRIERKYSRYRDDSVLTWIHEQRGAALLLDEETGSLLDFARQCFDLSEGAFDITSGVLRRVWRFDGSDDIPAAQAVAQLLPLIGFNKLTWRMPSLTVPVGMELDFGGIGKEYAVDRAYDLLMARCPFPFLINLGGDLRASRPLPYGPWKVAIERPGTDRAAAMLLDVEYGALATSGDSHRYLMKDGVRYSHILDPRTGWPVRGAPRSVTVAASSCTEAGLLSTLAMLRGPQAKAFLEEQGVRFWLLP
jgi:thiamine biosynthesis lipoprotein